MKTAEKQSQKLKEKDTREKKPEQKPISELLKFSIINLDKPSGPTSFSISDYVRKKLGRFGIKKTSHFGTLDPMVSGILPIALGRACKLTGFFLGEDKGYAGILHAHKEQDMQKLQEIINKNFLGKIKQLPPKKSRVKRAVREREIKKWQLLEQGENKKDFLFIAEVQGGTYIRKLCSDLGGLINGSHMLELRRIRAGIFDETSNFVNLYEFEKAVDEFEKGNEEELRKILIPAEEAIKRIMPTAELQNKKQLKKFLTGKPLFKNEIKLPEENQFAVFSENKFIGIYRKVSEKNIIAKPEFVFN